MTALARFVGPGEEVVVSVHDDVGERSGADFVIDDLTFTTNGQATLTIRGVMVNDEPPPGTASAVDFTVTVTPTTSRQAAPTMTATVTGSPT